MRSITTPLLIILTSIFIVLFDNVSFFKHVLETYPFTMKNVGFLLSLGIILYALIVILLTTVSSRYILKPVIIISLILASLIAYFMQSYNIVIDKTMIENTLQTDIHESMDLLSIKLIIYLILLGILPSWLVYKIPLQHRVFKTELWSKIKLILSHLILIVLLLFSFSKFYTSFFREHKDLRLYTNPVTAVYNLVSYTYDQVKDTNIPMKKIGQDAKQLKDTTQADRKRKIVIMVVGEAARSDHFSLNGYTKETNPLLKKEDIINFSQMYSCGTTTAVSVPCMFSMYGRDDYDSTKGNNTYNVLDVLSHAGIEVLWRDNNSDSKGVALRVPYENYKTPHLNTVCQSECRDVGMIKGLENVIAKSNKDILIVLHQMGNHGPAYFKRYPDAFKKFTPTCETNQLETCTTEEINNAYDNALLYTDYFLTQVVDFLKKYDEKAQTAMIYIADHGESLGENGLYLHGLPYFIAPEHQKHVGAFMWFGKNFPVDKEKLKTKSDHKYSQDNLFSTLLGLFNVQTKVYKKEMDILRQ
ncbi:phosphoethanolamine transferase [Sulfurovum sp.]|uniref:phosphoethanolamine transferase n=1 Tax=Sulfurovum sp. TaxID=1969726 RepID=UPI0025EE24B0|nr:phosphoethanolamine--lipid A transferase [Sulfurovum sp.]